MRTVHEQLKTLQGERDPLLTVAKNFAEADRIRKLLLEQGIVLKDSSAGTTWEAAQ